MSRPQTLEPDDRIRIDHEALSGRTFRVSDVDVSDVGITETVAVTLVGGSERFALTGTTADSSFTLEDVDTGEEWTVFAQRIDLDN